MNFELKLNCDNGAFWSPELEIQRILNELAKKIENGLVEGIIQDHNGNTVGKWGFTDIDTEIDLPEFLGGLEKEV